MSNLKRRTHYIPEFYLAGFTHTGKKKNSLWISDKSNGKQYFSTPKDTAVSKDFYRANIPDEQSDIIENSLERIESSIAPVIKSITSNKRLPSTLEEFDSLISFVALMSCRVPEYFNTMKKLYENREKEYLRDWVKSKESWETALLKIGQVGAEIRSNITYEEMKRFIDKNKYSVFQPKNLQLLHMYETMSALIDILYKRKWSLLNSKTGSIRFISSDNPVTIIDKNYLPGITNVGFGISNSELAIPLNKNCALVGSFEEDRKIIKGEDYDIAHINMRTFIFATRFIYSTDKEILLIAENNDKSVKNYSFHDALKFIEKSIEYEDLISD